MQLSSPPVMDFNSFLLSFLPACSSKFFMFLIFSELVLTKVLKINEYISLYVEKIINILTIDSLEYFNRNSL